MFFDQYLYRVTSSLIKQLRVFRADYSSLKSFRAVIETYGEVVRIKDPECLMPENWTLVLLWFACSTRQPIALQNVEKTSFFWIMKGYSAHDLRELETSYHKRFW